MNPIPFSVIGGFLGAGKTTLVNRLLQNVTGTRYAVLVNDFGAINIDQSLIAQHAGQTLSLTNGCICCSLANGFVKTMLKLMQHPEKIDHIIVEASGVSDPSRIMDFARLDPALREDAIIVMVDALNFPEQLSDPLINDVLKRQIKQAGLLVANKIDLVGPENLEALNNTLTDLNSDAMILPAKHADLPIDVLFEASNQSTGDYGKTLPLSHAEGVLQSVAFRSDQIIDDQAFMEFAESLPAAVIRGKGRLKLISGSYHWSRVAYRHQLISVNDPVKFSELVLIGVINTAGFDAIRRSALNGLFETEIR